MTKDYSEFNKYKKFNRIYWKGVATPQGRFSWPSLDAPKQPRPPKEGEQPREAKYEVTLLLNKSDEAVKAFEALLTAKATDMVSFYNEGSSTKLGGVDVFKDGDTFDAEKYPYYKNHWLLLARSKEQPKAVDEQKLNMDPAQIKGGFIGRMVIVPNLGASGMSYKLEVVQFLKDDGVRFGGTKQDYDSLLDACSEDTEDTTEQAPDDLPQFTMFEAEKLTPKVEKLTPQQEKARNISQSRANKGKSAIIDTL